MYAIDETDETWGRFHTCTYCHSGQRPSRKRICSKVSGSVMNFCFLFFEMRIRANMSTYTADITFFTLLMTYQYWWQPLNFLRGWWTIISDKEEGRWYFRRGEGVAGGTREGNAGRLGDAKEEQGPQTNDGQTGTADLCCNTAWQVPQLNWGLAAVHIMCYCLWYILLSQCFVHSMFIQYLLICLPLCAKSSLCLALFNIHQRLFLPNFLCTLMFSSTLLLKFESKKYQWLIWVSKCNFYLTLLNKIWY